MTSAQIPLMLILAGWLLVPPAAMRKPLMQRAVVAVVALVVGRYLWWRLTVTVLPTEGITPESVLIWTLFGIEMLAWTDAGIMFLALLARTDRSPEADLHEARLRALPPAELPEVDVLIATYNEPLDVLEKTILGALVLDWPMDRLNVWVLDDGRRDWLRDYCAAHGARYLTRTGNAHAKAGNINAAIKRTAAPFFLVLDADFVPQRQFLFRAMGFFQDPRIGIVQIPHNFFNSDPMQASLGLRRALPDDQRFFFDTLMPGRDGWDCAFCCGSNGIVRRSAIEEVGGGLPTGSITEDMLLTLALMRRGYITRFLGERLAIGLAPESLAAFFVQRARWARGGIQILHLKDGPLGPGLGLVTRLMFLPTHWLTQCLSQVAAMAVPALYLLTGIRPLLNARTPEVLSYQIPAIVVAILAVRLFAPRHFFPLAATAHAVLQAFRLLPTVLVTLVRPHGHAFKVTPKGRGVGGGAEVDRLTVGLSMSLLIATALGLFLNADINTRLVEPGALVPVVAFWAIVNMIVLSVVATIAVSAVPLRAEERFDIAEPCRLMQPGQVTLARTRDLSLGGAAVVVVHDPGGEVPGDWFLLELAGVGLLPAKVMRRVPVADGTLLGLRFALEPGGLRNRLVQRLFTSGLDAPIRAESAARVTLAILSRVLRGEAATPAPPALPTPVPPDWIIAATAETAWLIAEWEADACAPELRQAG